MALQGTEHSVAPEVVTRFLRNIMPFKDLPPEVIQGISRQVKIDFFPKGTKLLQAGKSEINHLYLIQQGGVKSFIVDDEGVVTLKDYRGEGDYIGALGIIRGTPANLDVETVEDTFCFLLPKEVFLHLISSQPGFSQYYLKTFSEKIVAKAYTELRHHRMAQREDGALYLFSIQVGDIIRQSPHKIAADKTIQQAAAKMAEFRVGSLLLHDPVDEEKIIGIITDRDLRNKVLAPGLDSSLVVSSIMSFPVATVLSQSTCFDALIKMMSTSIHHLAVEQKERIIGVITSHDITMLQGNAPYSLFKEIGRQKKIEGLYPLSQKIPEMIRNLIKEGAKAGHISRMISILNDQILEQLLTLLEEEMGPPPVNYCWLLMGSEGRREQTFRTDQDNAIIYEDPGSPEQAQEAEAYFSEFSQKAIDHLVLCGYPLCPGEIMAVNPRWRQPLSVWKGYFEAWVATPDPQELLHASIFFDFRSGFGESYLAEELRQHLNSISRRQELYLLHLARQCIASRPPLSFFKNFIVEKDGEHKNKLDIKIQGLTPFVNFARILALKNGIRETNTLARLHVSMKENIISEELWAKAVEAYEMQMQLRLFHQLNQLEEDTLPDNHIDPKELSELDKRMLRDAFEVIDRLSGVLKTMFPGV
jgi:CBS domain-containing protein